MTNVYIFNSVGTHQTARGVENRYQIYKRNLLTTSLLQLFTKPKLTQVHDTVSDDGLRNAIERCLHKGHILVSQNMKAELNRVFGADASVLSIDFGKKKSAFVRVDPDGTQEPIEVEPLDIKLY